MAPPPLDEAAAWEFLQALRGGGEGGREGPSIDSSGRWEARGGATPEARELLDLLLPVALPEALVLGQLGQSLDGRIATEEGHSHYVTGPEDRRRLHRVRALVDAVVVGAGTVASDDPSLTVRMVEGRNPVRVVLDPSGRLGPDRRVFSDGAAETLVIRHAGEASGGTPGSESLFLPVSGPRGFAPSEVLALLAARGLQRVLVEGGGITVSRFLQAGALDRLHLTVAPLVMGSGRPGITLEPIRTLDEALRPPCRRFSMGEDVLFDLDLRGAPHSHRPRNSTTAPGRLETRTSTP